MFMQGDDVIDENGDLGIVALIYPPAKRSVLVYVPSKEKWRAFYPDGRRELNDPTPRIHQASAPSGIVGVGIPIPQPPTMASGYGKSLPKTLKSTTNFIDDTLKQMEPWERAFGMSAKSLTPQCTCDIKTLMVTGCTCGHIKRRSK